MLGIALSKSLKEKSVSEYFSEKFWQPLGMNDDGLWHTDAKGMELTFCCVSTNARNFAKIGQLLLNEGVWQDQQLLQKAFITRMITPNMNNYYGHSVWVDYHENPSFYALLGHLGQYIIVMPEHNLVVVRLGKAQSEHVHDDNRPFHEEVMFYADQAVTLVKLAEQATTSPSYGHIDR